MDSSELSFCRTNLLGTKGSMRGISLKPIVYKRVVLNLPWDSDDLAHELTTKGIHKFGANFQSTLRRSA